MVMGLLPQTEILYLRAAPGGPAPDPVPGHLPLHAAESGPANRGHSQQKSLNQNRGGAGMSYNLVTVGNPNSGKTSLFNALTGSRQQVGNWSRVTVDKKMGPLLPAGRNTPWWTCPASMPWPTRRRAWTSRSPVASSSASSRICCSTSSMPPTWSAPLPHPATAGAGAAHGGGAQQDGSAAKAAHHHRRGLARQGAGVPRGVALGPQSPAGGGLQRGDPPVYRPVPARPGARLRSAPRGDIAELETLLAPIICIAVAAPCACWRKTSPCRRPWRRGSRRRPTTW